MESSPLQNLFLTIQASSLIQTCLNRMDKEKFEESELSSTLEQCQNKLFENTENYFAKLNSIYDN